MNAVFISYRHESIEHSKTVRDLAERLQAAGIKVKLDQFCSPGGPDDGGWVKWCEDCATDADCVLIIPSAGYYDSWRNKPDNATRGVAWEAHIIKSIMFNQSGQNERFRCVIPDESLVKFIPESLISYNRFMLTAQNDQFDTLQAWINQRLRRIYVAENFSDMDYNREGLVAELKKQGCNVVPKKTYTNYDKNKVAVPLNNELDGAIAFVQLLEPSRWKGGEFEYTQYEAAVAKKGLPTFRWRDPDLNLEIEKLKDSPDPKQQKHYKFLKGADVKAIGFTQFKNEFLQKLKEIQEGLDKKKEPAPTPSMSQLQVVVLARNPDELFQKMSMWLERETKKNNLRYTSVFEYKPSEKPLYSRESFRRRNQGFLLLCDATTIDSCEEQLKNTTLNYNSALSECYEIQDEINDIRRWPSVCLAIQPPPNDLGAKFAIRSMPGKFTKVLASDKAGLNKFISEVIDVAK